MWPSLAARYLISEVGDGRLFRFRPLRPFFGLAGWPSRTLPKRDIGGSWGTLPSDLGFGFVFGVLAGCVPFSSKSQHHSTPSDCYLVKLLEKVNSSITAPRTEGPIRPALSLLPLPRLPCLQMSVVSRIEVNCLFLLQSTSSLLRTSHTPGEHTADGVTREVVI